MQKPAYFDDIQQNSIDLWQQLEQNREIAAPWHQLFKQVQSPRHVLSELLQNADDAEATEVNVQLKDGVFSFIHNGRDFTKEDFASLCRFGYSNKRLLRTIGFRGIGFKSTFSLGNTVALSTPTLSVEFHKSKFTLPHWVDGNISSNGTTHVLVKFGNKRLQTELENNVAEWLNSPFSLLFFNHIRSLKLGEQELSWNSVGVGPVANSERMALVGDDQTYLVIRSESEPFPDEALKEIDDERLLETGESVQLPPSRVELVLGAPGQLFVVLPTGVKTSLPFAVNAPFIQDPARLKIKDPETSFTNRWLLERIGKLAAQSMIHWLENKDLGVLERAKSYDIMPDSDTKNDSLENACKVVVEKAFLNQIQNQAYVLTDGGELAVSGKCASVPISLWGIWTESQIADILQEWEEEPLLFCRHVDDKNRKKLYANDVISSYEQDDILNALTRLTPPKPMSWTSLLELWNFAGRWGYSWRAKSLNIHPVRGRDVLLSTNKVVRLGEKRLLQSEDDWDFLAKHLLVLDVNWLRYLTEQRRVSEETNNGVLREKVNVADQLLMRAELDKPSNIDMVLDQVAQDFFSVQSVDVDECVRMAQIASRLNAKSGNSFKFFTQDGKLRLSNELILFDEKGLLEEFVPPSLRESSILHERYSRSFTSCTKDEWLEWIDSGNAGVRRFISLSKEKHSIYGDSRVKKEVEDRGQSNDAIGYQYKTSLYELEDWDFPTEYWRYWETCSENDASFWARLLEQILKHRTVWEIAQSARIFHVATTGNRKPLVYKPLLPTWILKFQKLPCLRDTRGNYCIPHDLMCRTPQTEPLMDVEPFVDARWDTEAARGLLILLDVRDRPSGPTQIMERLRALAKATKPPLLELTKWYQRLDALFENCSTDDQQKVRSCFREEKLILAEDGTWQTSETIYISAEDHDAPGAALIYSLANQLSLWRKIGVNERPTAELAIQWLMSLPKDEKLSSSDAQRARSLLGRHPIRIWKECERWLNLSGEWVSTDQLKYCLTMKSLFRYGHLFDWVKTATADFQMLSIDLARELPFSALPTLASQVEKHLEQSSELGQNLSISWLQTLGRLLSRIHIDDDVKAQYIHTQAKRLANTSGVQVKSVSTIPYLDGKPAGLAEIEDLVWVGEKIYIATLSNARLASRLSKQIANVFDWSEMEALLTYCFERDDTSIYSYLQENFSLNPEETDLPAEDLPVNVSEHPEKPVTDLPSDTNTEIESSTPAEDREIPNGTGDDGGMDHPGEPHVPHPTTHPLPKTSLLERFALSQGYRKRDSQQFIHDDGRVLIKSEGVFPWVVQDSTGTISLYYWTREHCLELKPLDLPTEVWHLIEQDPRRHALLLEDRNGGPVELLGTKLVQSKQFGQLSIHPAMYRISLQKDL